MDRYALWPWEQPEVIAARDELMKLDRQKIRQALEQKKREQADEHGLTVQSCGELRREGEDG